MGEALSLGVDRAAFFSAPMTVGVTARAASMRKCMPRRFLHGSEEIRR